LHIVFLVLALLSSLSIALLLRVFEGRRYNRVVIIASNYPVAGGLGILLGDRRGIEVPAVWFGAVLGALFFIAFVVFSRAIRSQGVASAVTMGRLSLAVPVVLSILLWGERPLAADLVAIGLVFAIILAWEGRPGRLSPVLALLFCLFGTIDSAIKYFKLRFDSVDDGSFLVVVFLSAALWSWLWVVATGQRIAPAEVRAGLLLGAPNFFSTYFLLKALAQIPAFVAFPFVNVGMIILSSAAGWLVFHEELGRRKLGLVALGVVAVWLLAS